MSVSKSARSVLLGSAFLATGLTSAWAEPATLQGAQQLTDVLARYVGHVLFDKGILTISPRGEGYDFTVEVDSRKLLPDVKGKSFHYGPKSLFAIPPADGTLTLDWQAVGQDFSEKTGPSLTLGEATGKIGDCNAHLVFDPRPAGSLSATGSCDSFAVKVPASTEDIDATIGKVTARVTMRPGSNGSTDSDADFQMHDLVERITLKVPDKAPEDIVVRMGKLQEGIALSGFQTSQYDTLNKFVLDNAKPGEPLANQDELKAKARDLLPIWQRFSVYASMTDASVGTPLGIFKLASLEETLAASGLVKDANYSLGFKIAGFAAPDAVVPSWARPYVPTDATLAAKLSGIDGDAIARATIDALDSTRQPPLPADFGLTLLGMLAEGKPHVDISHTLVSPAMDVKGDGTVGVPGGVGTAAISAAGLQGLIDAINQSPLPDKGKALLGLAFIKGLSKTNPDGRFTWNVDFDALAKKVTVNGQTFGPGPH